MSRLVISEKIVNSLTREEHQHLETLYKIKCQYENNYTDKFSICITDHWAPEHEKHTLIYVLDNNTYLQENNRIRILEGASAKVEAFRLAAKDFINRGKSVLLYLGKFPGYGFDIDGGSILARQLIDSLKIRCNLTVCFIRKNKETFLDRNVCKVRYVEYKDPWNNKFIRRLENLDTNHTFSVF